jgi:CIC family chloride channel protein
MQLSEFYKLLSNTSANIFAVVSKNGSLEGVVLVDQIRKQLFDQDNDASIIEEIMVLPPAVIDYDEPVSSVMEAFDATDSWQLPVVDGERFVGFISKSALLAKYREVFIKQYKESDLFAHI